MPSILGTAAPTSLDQGIAALFAQPQKRKLAGDGDTTTAKKRRASDDEGDGGAREGAGTGEKKSTWARKKERARLAKLAEGNESAATSPTRGAEKGTPRSRAKSSEEGEDGGDVKTEGEEGEEEEDQDNAAKLSRTVFIGNVVTEVLTKKSTKKEFTKLLEQYGTLESVRFRSIAFSAPLARRTALAAKLIHPNRDSCNAYAVFATEDQATACAQGLNGMVWMERHLRGDLAGRDGPPDPKRSVFLGNLPMDCRDEQLWELFKDMEAEIDAVRVVRDAKTNVGRGVGYITFKTRAAAHLALSHTGTVSNREVRIVRCKPHIPRAPSGVGSVAAPGSHKTSKSERPEKVHGAIRRLVGKGKLDKPLHGGLAATEGERAVRGDLSGKSKGKGGKIRRMGAGAGLGGVKPKAKKKVGGSAGGPGKKAKSGKK
ncbi:RNA-binding domain-containing protein [Gonapodya prolifera JEL478]|uniref:Nucleolar protein 12 n=1 Tax=Gonapodya prolifera (strain JEL478) TaxID=1344416 RepID=A0A139A154_GONPJ|nr:RNA-binding domain-containing protein [Gonapodya prolifera JEL478]|eukprot:KXS10083.1 RNA-binding domain-containing protein [Gonapodya prolifera JEL478]